ncbi:2-dehydro-3-deoxygalactonokinase [Clostridium sp. Marseille-P3244]|uniref:2-dehydro-3-deoxygalactonokinase n=1 Tax=Clostridium sp. Marseille-P3244 TaxID=1871020 RepID=UPI0009303B02|nr:2-dehydro-3-deoxygalactonokinase [Clostridium sp. Marseille-P3244]
MKYILTIDTGTTNTRVLLWKNKTEPVRLAQTAVGVRNTAVDGTNRKLKAGLRQCMEQILHMEGICWDDVGSILAAGMITSELGLVEIPHVEAPAGVRELSLHMEKHCMPEICPLPVWFIPGIRNQGSVSNLSGVEQADMMRGEEVESLALLQRFPEEGQKLLVLPGSHTKYISVDEQGKIQGSATSIAGELLEAITKETSIAKTVDSHFAEEENYDSDMALLGYKTARDVGIGRACFCGRIMEILLEQTPDRIASYILGAILESDIRMLNSSAISGQKKARIIIAGKNPLRQALYEIFSREVKCAEVTQYIPEKNAVPLSAAGAMLVAKQAGLL